MLTALSGFRHNDDFYEILARDRVLRDQVVDLLVVQKAGSYTSFLLLGVCLHSWDIWETI